LENAKQHNKLNERRQGRYRGNLGSKIQEEWIGSVLLVETNLNSRRE
jgi:hypothetical protein